MTTTIKKNVIASLLLLSTGFANASGNDVTIKMLLGEKSLDSNWGKNDSMDSIGLQFTYLPASVPVGVALDFYGSGNEEKTNGIKTETTVAEINLGVRWQPQLFSDSWAPYLGGGVSYAAAELQDLNSGKKSTYKDNGVGFWVGGGIDFIFTERWSIGVDARYSEVDVKLNGQTVDAGGLGFGATVGYRF
ncbi:outer membrane protein [Vibrio cyclitrophicus]|uniref:outer membrane protein n=1 Tax=Vibrio cyclitrophicus TaxID=47951 RepID=UPI000C852B58|nr:outer membrane beta-barrel protein [Vibrio cyclitrophicus]PMH77119.1 hypothetical protein BCU59_10245 [Vibrio cyclitrophicus]